MFVTVKLLNQFSKSLTYSLPHHLHDSVNVGSVVQVPLQKRIEGALVVAKFSHGNFPFALRDVHSVYELPHDTHYAQFLEKISWYHQVQSTVFLQRIQTFIEMDAQETDVVSLELPEENKIQSVQLTQEQSDAVQGIIACIDAQKYEPICLQGVTGSGKTEVYKKIIEYVLAQSKSIIFLLPEVSLAMRFETIFKTYFNSEIVFGFHSATSAKHKKILWQHILQSKPCIIIGVHLPPLLPIPNLGLLIIDEEHDVGFQEKKHPHAHTKDLALFKAQCAQIPIVLGSATPSFETLWNVQHKQWKHLILQHRFAGSMPQTQIVSLVQDQKKDFWISKKLDEAIRDRLEKKEQTILFLNRRGHSFFVQCKSCGHVPMCTYCSVSLTLHQNGLQCHYCGLHKDFSEKCFSCKQGTFLKKGIGTQQLVDVIKKLYPGASVARADMDSVKQKKSWQQTVQNFYDGHIDILIGTQTITKGYHFPGVTLVGVLWADLQLSFPFYNAVEVAYAQLLQVSGRAGRQSERSLVIVQTLAQHYVYDVLDEKKYMQLYEHELQARKECQYPPYVYLSEIEITGGVQEHVEQESVELVQFLQKQIDQQKLQTHLLGPVQAPVYKKQNIFTQKVYLKSDRVQKNIALFASLEKSKYNSDIRFIVHPVK
jgi:primosomal protein N' (replication factor Y)